MSRTASGQGRNSQLHDDLLFSLRAPEGKFKVRSGTAVIDTTILSDQVLELRIRQGQVHVLRRRKVLDDVVTKAENDRTAFRQPLWRSYQVEQAAPNHRRRLGSDTTFWTATYSVLVVQWPFTANFDHAPTRARGAMARRPSRPSGQFAQYHLVNNGRVARPKPLPFQNMPSDPSAALRSFFFGDFSAITMAQKVLYRV